MESSFKVSRNVKDSLRKTIVHQWKTGKFCDVKFSVGDDTIEAHKCVLAAASQYFDIMFTASFTEKDMETINLSPTFKNYDNFKNILEFIYGIEIDIDETSVEEILRGADLFRLTELVEDCMRYLLQNLQLQNCLWTWSMADAYSLKELAEICLEYVETRFSDTMVKMDEFLATPPEHILKLAKKGMINFFSRGEAVAFIEHYVAHDSIARCPLKDELLRAIVQEGSDKKMKQKMENTGKDLKTKKTPTAKKSPVEQLESNMQACSLSQGAKPKQKSADSETVDTLIVSMKSAQRWCIYDFASNQWLSVPHTWERIGSGWTMLHVGVGPKGDHAILESDNSGRFKVMNLVSGFGDFVLNEVPATGPEKRSLRSERIMYWMKNYNGELHHFAHGVYEHFCDSSKKKGKFTTTENRHGIFIHRLDFNRRLWKFVCVAVEKRQEILRIETPQQKDDTILILLCLQNSLEVHQYIPAERKAAYIFTFSNVTMPSWHRFCTALYTTGDKIVMLHAQKQLVINLRTKTASEKKGIKIAPEKSAVGCSQKGHLCIGLSQCEGKCYILESIHRGNSTFMKYDPITKEMEDLTPLPILKVEGLHIRPLRMPAKGFVHLSPLTMLSLTREPLLPPSEVTKAMERYRSRMDKPWKSSRDCRENKQREEKEEDTAAWMNNEVLFRQEVFREWINFMNRELGACCHYSSYD